jgi:hypothetical protein
VKVKTLTEIKAEGDAGHVKAVFSTFNVIDHDNDVTLPGAFEEGAPVRISAFNHSSNRGAVLPVGRGVIEADDEKAMLDGQFFMATTGGKDTFEVVKQMADLGEWSYGYDVLDEAKGKFGEEEKDVNFLKSLKVHEVSPVLLGAGIDTRTLVAKGLVPDELILGEDLDAVIKALLLHDHEQVATALVEATNFNSYLDLSRFGLKVINERDAEGRRTGKGTSDEDRAAVDSLESEFARLRDRFVQPSVRTEIRKAQRSMARASVLLSSHSQASDDDAEEATQ